MNKWLLYLGWLVGWLVVLWSFVFVPYSNLFRGGDAIDGAIRGLILVSGWGLLFYGFRFINKHIRVQVERKNVERTASTAEISTTNLEVATHAALSHSGGLADSSALRTGTGAQDVQAPRFPLSGISPAVVWQQPVADQPPPENSGKPGVKGRASPTKVLDAFYAIAASEIESGEYPSGACGRAHLWKATATNENRKSFTCGNGNDSLKRNRCPSHCPQALPQHLREYHARGRRLKYELQPM